MVFLFTASRRSLFGSTIKSNANKTGDLIQKKKKKGEVVQLCKLKQMQRRDPVVLQKGSFQTQKQKRQLLLFVLQALKDLWLTFGSELPDFILEHMIKSHDVV